MHVCMQNGHALFLTHDGTACPELLRSAAGADAQSVQECGMSQGRKQNEGTRLHGVDLVQQRGGLVALLLG